MKGRWLPLVLVAVLISTLIPIVTSCGSKNAGAQGDLDAFRAALEKEGFIVQEGVLSSVDLIDLYNKGLIDSCNANNANNPYLAYMLPTTPGQSLKEMGTDAPINPAHKDLWFVNRYRQDETLIYIGKTPPSCDYFSFCFYLNKRFFPEEGIYKKIFASTGDTQNLLTIKTSGGDGNPFSQNTMVITTADRGIDKRIRSAAESAGYPASIMNTIVIPTEVVRMGLDDKADTFLMLMRTAHFNDEESGKAFIDSPDAIVWRITPAEQTQPDLYPTSTLRVRGTGTTEMELMPALNDLREAILVKHGHLEATELTTSIWLPEGYVAIQEVIDVLGETRDTVYLRTDSFKLKDDPNEFVIVYGVNHAATGKATYSNLGVYGVTAMNGIGGVSNHDLAGTAEEYLTGHPQAKYLYVWKVARHALGDPNIVEVPYGVKANGIDLDQEGFIGWRAYLEPETKVGPIWHELVFDRGIKFSEP